MRLTILRYDEVSNEFIVRDEYNSERHFDPFVAGILNTPGDRPAVDELVGKVISADVFVTYAGGVPCYLLTTDGEKQMLEAIKEYRRIRCNSGS